MYDQLQSILHHQTALMSLTLCTTWRGKVAPLKILQLYSCLGALLQATVPRTKTSGINWELLNALVPGFLQSSCGSQEYEKVLYFESHIFELELNLTGSMHVSISDQSPHKIGLFTCTCLLVTGFSKYMSLSAWAPTTSLQHLPRGSWCRNPESSATLIWEDAALHGQSQESVLLAFFDVLFSLPQLSQLELNLVQNYL